MDAQRSNGRARRWRCSDCGHNHERHEVTGGAMSTRSSRCTLIALTTLLCVATASASEHRGTKGAQKAPRNTIFNVPGLPDLECGSANSPATPKCEATKFDVQVFPVKDATGTVRGCLSSFGYNHLNIRTSPRKEATTVTWVLDPGANAKFSGDGISITVGGSGHPPGNLFELPLTIAANGLSVSAKVKQNIGGGRKFNHQPVVTLNSGGTVITCLGVDPTIGNSAN
jgi:hypothetical protein